MKENLKNVGNKKEEIGRYFKRTCLKYHKWKLWKLIFKNINKWANPGLDKLREIISESDISTEGFIQYTAQREKGVKIMRELLLNREVWLRNSNICLLGVPEKETGGNCR